MAAPVASITVPLTWATAVAWASTLHCEPEKRKSDVSKTTPIHVDRDVRVIYTVPLRTTFCPWTSHGCKRYRLKCSSDSSEFLSICQFDWGEFSGLGLKYFWLSSPQIVIQITK